MNGRQQDEDEARDRDGSSEMRIEPAPLPDDVKHARAPRVGTTAGPAPRATNSSSRRPYSDGLRAQSWRTTQRRIGPGHDDRAEHRDEHADDQDEREAADRPTTRTAYRIVAVMRLDTFESRIEFQARLKPASTAAGQRLADAQLLLHPLEDEDVGVDRHAHREHEARDPGQRQRHRHEPEDREHHERVVDEREARDDARQPVVDEHERSYKWPLYAFDPSSIFCAAALSASNNSSAEMFGLLKLHLNLEFPARRFIAIDVRFGCARGIDVSLAGFARAVAGQTFGGDLLGHGLHRFVVRLANDLQQQ